MNMIKHMIEDLDVFLWYTGGEKPTVSLSLGDKKIDLTPEEVRFLCSEMLFCLDKATESC